MLSLTAQASTLSIADATALAQQRDLPHNPAWLALVHYRTNHITGDYTSEADDPRFFLSPKGKHSPNAELKATLQAILTPGQGNKDARCRFPARDHWLRQALGIPQTPVSCPALDAWLKKLDTAQVTLVFAASYLNSPSSMFGHTFLRLDPPSSNTKTDLLLASTVSYAADANATDSEIVFAYRGIFGGYPGVTSVRPYYEKIKQYSDIENRDLWEYRLNLKPQEIQRLLWHSWEVQNIRFDYYFFDENCAYRLLELLDVARPGLDLTARVTTHAIPSDTVRWVVDAGLVDHVHYRPSSATAVAYQIRQLSPLEQKLTRQLADGTLKPTAPQVQALPPARRAEVLDTTYNYVQYMAIEDKWPRKRVAPLSYQLLAARSALDLQSAPPQPPTPKIRDDQGHDTFRFSIAGGRDAHRNIVRISLRPAYHDLLDSPGGYRPGAQLQFLRFDGRYYPDNDSLRVDQVTGVEIRSLSPRNAFFRPLSWQVGFGARRRMIANGQEALTPYLDGGAGFAWAPTTEWLAIAMGTADLEISQKIAQGYHAAPGVDLMLLHQGGTMSVAAGVRSKLWLTTDYSKREDTAYLRGDWHIRRNFGLFTSLDRTHYLNRYRTSWLVGFHTYF